MDHLEKAKEIIEELEPAGMDQEEWVELATGTYLETIAHALIALVETMRQEILDTETFPP